MFNSNSSLGSLQFRPIQTQDQAFLCQVYASTRSEEMMVLPWTEEEKHRFLEMQFQAQHSHYQQYYAQAEFLIILQADQPIGRLYLDRRHDEIRIVDIALLPAYRNRGIGTALLYQILAEATQKGLLVRIHVETFNPALRLYQRLGFVDVETNGVYYLMEWRPPSHARLDQR